MRETLACWCLREAGLRCNLILFDLHSRVPAMRTSPSHPHLLSPIRFAAIAFLLASVAAMLPAGESTKGAYKVVVTDNKEEKVEVESAIDPTQRIRFQDRGTMMPFVTDEQGRQM